MTGEMRAIKSWLIPASKSTGRQSVPTSPTSHWSPEVGNLRLLLASLIIALGLLYLGDYKAVEPGYYMTIANWLNCAWTDPTSNSADLQTLPPVGASTSPAPILTSLPLSTPEC